MTEHAPEPKPFAFKVHRLIVEEVARTLQLVFQEGVYADKAIEKTMKKQAKWGSRDRKLYAEAVYEIVRWWRLLWTLMAQQMNMSEHQLIRLWGIYWLLKKRELPNWNEFKNLRIEEIEKRLESLHERAIVESIPDWLDQLGEKELGERWPAILHSLNGKAEVFLRLNSLKTDPRKLRFEMEKEEIDVEPVADVPSAFRLTERKNVFVTEAFKRGLFEVQDASSQRVAPFLGAQPGDRVIDACAGAGGKSLHLAALMRNQGKVLALDIHEWKLNELKTRARRNGVDIIETRVIDSTKVIKRLKDSADRLLLDVPCSGLGVLKRNPDTKWKLDQAELDRLRKLQAEILSSYSSMVKTGGQMVYATCSILPSENEQQVEDFLKSPGGADWALKEQMRMDPDITGYDGFFAALLQKK